MTKSVSSTAELVDLLHNRFRWPRPTKVEPRPASVGFNIGERRFVAFTDLGVLEVAGDKVGETDHSRYAQGVLRGGRRTEDGTLIVEGENA